jgi:RimJ/RimL family protein N-acetyltransferase
VAFVSGSEGQYLAGDPACQEAQAGLREAIPFYAYLLVDPPEWEGLLPRVWRNPAARRHHRQHHLFRGARAPAWRERLPSGAQMVRLDPTFFARAGLKNFEAVAGWADEWPSREDFFRRGGGACLVVGETIASWSLLDCALGERCEIGVMTDSAYRQRGFGTLVVSAVLEESLARGYREIGWQCQSTNVGSQAVARRVGFVKERDYLGFSSWMPAENPGDLSPAEYADWAQHYELHGREAVGWAFQAAEAWALAGQPERALQNLRALGQAGWQAQPQWLSHNWTLDSLRGLPVFQALAAALVNPPGDS